MKISYAITVCNEIEEIKRLVLFLLKHKREEDEIVVQQDSTNLPKPNSDSDPVYEYLSELFLEKKIEFSLHPLNNDFASFKNNLTRYCSGDYIFQIDADEMPHENLIKQLPELLESNSNVDLLWVSRINTVENITEEHISKWGWRVNEKNWVNFPDQQSRIYKNSSDIYWSGKVHERIVGYKQHAPLPNLEEWCLYHPKTIERQERQNEFYSEI